MRRSFEKELMDLPGQGSPMLEEDLRNLRTINRYLGGFRGILWALQSFFEKENRSSFSLLDVGTGSADLPITILRWAKARDLSAKIIGLETNADTVRIARQNTVPFPEISIVEGDALAPSIEPDSFDYVVFSQVLHHFSDAEIKLLLRTWAPIARVAILVSDLNRHALAYGGIWLFTRVITRNLMTRTDGPLSVRRSLTEKEWRAAAYDANIGKFELLTFFPFRVLIIFHRNGS